MLITDGIIFGGACFPVFVLQHLRGI